MDAPEEKIQTRADYSMFFPVLFDAFRICVDEDKEGFMRINAKQAKEVGQRLIRCAKNNRMRISRKGLTNWAFTAHDLNEVHIFPKEAKRAGFKTTLAHGTLLAAGLEQYVRGLREEVENLTGKEYHYSGQTIKFLSPVYVRWFRRGKVNWVPQNVRAEEGNLILSILGISRGEQALECLNTSLTQEIKKPDSKLITPFTQTEAILGRSRIQVSEHDIFKYYKRLGVKPVESMAYMHAALFLIGNILEVSSRTTGKHQGIYRRMDFNFYETPKPGFFNTMIKLRGRPRSADGIHAYRFDVCCTQEDRPIILGEVACYSKEEIKLD